MTFNLADFPAAICARENIEIATPDDFLVVQWSRNPERVRNVIYAQVGALRAPTRGLSQVLLGLATHAPRFATILVESIAADIDEVRRHLGAGTDADTDSGSERDK